jgi:PAS domain S-box-containing protein
MIGSGKHPNCVEECFRAMLEGHAAVMLLVDPSSGLIRMANQSALRFYGYPREILCAMHLQDLGTLASAHVMDACQLALEKTQDRFEVIHTIASGDARTVEIVASPITLPVPPLLLCIIHDITRRQQEEQSRFAHVIASIPGAICTFLLRPDGRLSIPYASHAFEDLYGLSIADVRENIDALIARVPPDQVAHLIEAVTTSARTLQPWRNEYQYHHPTKGDIWIEGYSMPVMEDDGSIFWHGVATNITERKQAVYQLRESQIRMELALKGANLGTWDWYISTDCIIVNERWADMVGYTLAELEPMSYQTWTNLYHPDDFQQLITLAERHFAGENDFYECEVRMRHKNGAWIWVIDHGKVVEWDASGNPIYVTGTHLDITQGKHAEQALLDLNRTLEERIQQRTAEVLDLYEQAPIGYHSLNSDGIVIMVNQTQLSWMGYTYDELIGRPFTDFLSPSSQVAFPGQFMAFKQLGWMRNLEYDLLHKDGTRIPILISATAVYNDEGTYLMSRSAVFDNTERKKAEDALRESEEQNRLLFEESPDPVVLLDVTGTVVQMNRAFSLLTGYPSEKVVGRTLDVNGIVAPSQVGQLATAIAQHLQANTNFAAVELRLTRSNGEFCDVGVRVFGLRILGRPHYLTTMRDITIEKKTEDVLRLANAELARASRAKDEFLANMSHELRTPLNAILVFSEVLQDEIHGPVNESQQSALRNIEMSGQHLLTLINDILDLSKIEAGRLDLQIEPISIADMCQASLMFVREIAHKKQIQLNFTINDEMAEIDVDAKRLKQILVNLLNNAVKFTPAMGQVRLDVHVNVEADVVYFAIEDTGIGIAPEDFSRLFQPFRQLDSRLSRNHEGTGLGLSLVRRLAELHGGSVTVESEPAHGSRFTLALPSHSPYAIVTTSNEDGPLPLDTVERERLPLAHAQGVRILLAEDNEVNILAIREYLQAQGYEMFVAYDGYEAITQASEVRPAVILMDIQMPRMDGIEAIRRLRAMPDHVNTPIIALTALTMPGDRERCLAVGANEYLTKPVNLKGLIAMITYMVQAGTPRLT